MSTSQWLLLLALSLLWGAAFLFVGIAVHDLPVFTIVLVRLGLAALVLVPVTIAVGHRLPTTLAGWWPFMVMAVLNNVVPMSLIVAGQTQIAAGLASVLNATTPLFALLVAFALAGERLVRNKVVGILLGIVGVAILVGPAAVTGKTSSVLGMSCVLGGALSYGFSGLWGRRFASTPPMVTAAAQLTCSSLILLPITLLVDQPWRLPMPSGSTIAALVGLAVLSTALAYILFFRIMAVSGSNAVMLVTLLIPVSGLALGGLVLGEPIVINQMAGALVIALSLLVIDGRLVQALASRSPGKA